MDGVIVRSPFQETDPAQSSQHAQRAHAMVLGVTMEGDKWEVCQAGIDLPVAFMSIIQCLGLIALFPSNEISGIVLRKSLHSLSSACGARKSRKQTSGGMRIVQCQILLVTEL